MSRVTSPTADQLGAELVALAKRKGLTDRTFTSKELAVLLGVSQRKLQQVYLARLFEAGAIEYAGKRRGMRVDQIMFDWPTYRILEGLSYKDTQEVKSARTTTEGKSVGLRPKPLADRGRAGGRVGRLVGAAATKKARAKWKSRKIA